MVREWYIHIIGRFSRGKFCAIRMLQHEMAQSVRESLGRSYLPYTYHMHVTYGVSPCVCSTLQSVTQSRTFLQEVVPLPVVQVVYSVSIHHKASTARLFFLTL